MKLTEEARRAVRRAFYERIDKKLDPQAQARLFAEVACRLLELEVTDRSHGWWQSDDRARRGDG